MKKEMVKEFQTRIVGANRSELLIINYEMLIVELEAAKESLLDEQEVVFEKSMINAHKILRELTSGLDFSYDIANELMSIYIYVNKKLIDTSMNKNEESLEEALHLLNVLLEGWRQTYTDVDEPVVNNGQKVFAGLTYGKHNLNEMVDSQPNRGFKA